MRTRHDKGQAGLTLLLSIVATLFVIGLLVFIFVIMGSKIGSQVYDVGAGSVANESAYLNSSGYTLAKASSVLGFRAPVVVAVINTTSGFAIPSSNYTLTGNVLTNATPTTYTGIKVTYSYTYDQNNSATQVVSDTSSSISGVIDWFSIFITIGAMVVLILLVVIIIVAIKSSGLVDAGSPKAQKGVGTA